MGSEQIAQLLFAAKVVAVLETILANGVRSAPAIGLAQAHVGEPYPERKPILDED
jgi:hypothetical protein